MLAFDAIGVNTALVFVKPHALNDQAVDFVRDHLSVAGCTVQHEARIPACQIVEQGIIDKHYGTLAELALKTDPRALKVTDESKAQFKDMFGIEWEGAPFETNLAAQQCLGLSGADLEACWRAGPCLKLAPGTYVAKLEGHELYTLNGFYLSMREEYTAGLGVHCMVVDFHEKDLNWQAFRSEVIGATDPAEAVSQSLRSKMLGAWKELGLENEPSMKGNSVHASAGPLEALKERIVWLQQGGDSAAAMEASIKDDGFGRRLVDAGVDAGIIVKWLEDNPFVATNTGEASRIFDVTECMDSDEMVVEAPQYAQCA